MSNFHPHLAWTRPYKSQIGNKQGENVIFKSQEWYYIVSMHKYYQLSLFLILESFTKSQIFSPDWPKLSLIRSKLRKKHRENMILKRRE